MITRKYNLKLPGNLTVPFGGSTRGEKFHPGIDVANKEGTPIPAFADGRVVTVEDRTDGLGKSVKLVDKGGNTHQYNHLHSTLVKPGTIVKKGSSIARMGKSGGTSYSPSGNDPSHLDLRIANRAGKFLNPLIYLKNR